MTGKGKILIVDDEPNALRVLSAILQEEGYTVREALLVDQALDVIRTERVDAIITDVRMPARDGFQLFNYIRKHHARIPVMFLTAYGTVESAVDAITNGAYYYFIKPPDYQKLKPCSHRPSRTRTGAGPARRDPAAAGLPADDPCQIIGTAPPIAGSARPSGRSKTPKAAS